MGHETEGTHLDPDCYHWFPHVYDWNMEFPVRSRVRLLGIFQQNTGICPMTLESKVRVLGHRDPAPSSPTQVTCPQKFSFCLHFTV